ncbi:MAG: hypothetical protein WD535_05670, partial [Thermaerobacterales bacterium]
MQWAPHVWRWLLPAAIGIVGGLLFVSIFSPFPYTIRPLNVTLAMRIMDHGQTRLVVPPAGQLMAQTHLSPLEISVTLMSVDIGELRVIAEEAPEGSELIDSLRADLTRVFRHFLIRTLILAGIGGGLGALIWGYRDPQRALIAVAAALVVYGTLLGLTYMTYDI